MWVTYRPEDGDEQRWDFQPGKVRSMMCIAIEKKYGQPFDKWKAGVLQGEMAARRVLLWHLLKRDHPSLRFEDVPDFYSEELVVEMSVAEVHEARERIAKANLSDAEREQAMAGFSVALADAEAFEAALGVESVGKAS